SCLFHRRQQRLYNWAVVGQFELSNSTSQASIIRTTSSMDRDLGHFGCHGGRDAQGLTDANERVGQTGETANAHVHHKVLPPHVRRADIRHAGADGHGANGRADAPGRAIAAFNRYREPARSASPAWRNRWHSST